MSEADSNWFLRHRDAIEHGPFRLADLVNAARAGNIADDTCVRHGSLTQNAWVFAVRVPPIQKAMPVAKRPEVAAKIAAPAPIVKTQPPPAIPEQPASAFKNSPIESARPESTAPAAAGTSIFRKPTAEVTKEPLTTNSEAIALPELGAAGATFSRSRWDDAFPVPRTFAGAVGALVTDFRFRRFVTPWIVKILWAICCLLVVVSLLALGYDFIVQPAIPTPEPKTSAGQWEFQPLNSQPFLQARLVVFSLYSSLVCLAILCIRVCCELVLIFFRVGGDLTEVRNFVRQQGTKSS
jgi:Domain of unknown function (DUF4282)